jgi:thioredoxin 1
MHFMESNKKRAEPIIIGGVVIMALLFLFMAKSSLLHSLTTLKGDTPMEALTMDFKKDVLDSPLPVLVDFWAPWCGPCRMVGPVIEGIAAKTGGKAKVVKVNVDENQEIARQYGMQGIPTVMVFKNGELATTLVGVQPEQTYLDALGI